ACPARAGAQYRTQACDSRAPTDRARRNSNREGPPVTDVMERVKAQQQFIGGQWVESASGKTLDVENPANGQVIAQVPASDSEDVDRAAEAAAKAFETWQKTTPAERASMLFKLADAIDANADELARLE